MVLNLKKYFVYLGKNCDKDMFIFYKPYLENSKEGVILRRAKDKKLTLDISEKTICREALQNIWALSRISTFLEID